MIPISQIDSEQSIYRNKTVVLWGAGYFGFKILEFLKSYDIPVSFFCDNSPSKWGTTWAGVPVISPEEVQKLQQQEDILIQVSVKPDSPLEQSVLSQLESLHITQVISSTEALMQLSLYLKIKAFHEQPVLAKEIEDAARQHTLYRQSNQKNLLHSYTATGELPLMICMVGKTGDVTLKKTLSQFIPVDQTHYPHWLQKDYINHRKLKIITAVREPIIRDLSSMYQRMMQFDRFKFFYPDFHPLDSEITAMYQSNDAQIYFDQFMSTDLSVQCPTWFDQFSQYVVDLRKHPFDQEKGYAIVQEGNYDIFVYQLEKLNTIIPELSQWVGVEFDQLKNGNMASDKWIGSSYKQAKQDIKITQEYFDACYNDSYIQHFYSQTDIAAFKEHWKSHIKQ